MPAMLFWLVILKVFVEVIIYLYSYLCFIALGILKEQYSSTEVVILAEFIKLIFSGYVAITDRGLIIMSLSLTLQIKYRE